ncbi:hypothetical protein Y032_0221g2584 [Ancylostoma ceylanicum]|uniref:Uncharacterized protein n=1 Tax=Ancylostoma ceylanicum TaxID=53326 RepID=A0A016SIA9_9BILA|nr:hypothetical protein Y032_0221g2584 [Ancylostoma ceylanicum]
MEPMRRWVDQEAHGGLGSTHQFDKLLSIASKAPFNPTQSSPLIAWVFLPHLPQSLMCAHIRLFVAALCCIHPFQRPAAIICQ